MGARDQVIVRDLTTGRDVRSVGITYESGDQRLDLTPDGSAVIFAEHSKWRDVNLRTGAARREWYVDKIAESLWPPAFSGDGRRIAVAGHFYHEAAQLVVWDREAGQVVMSAAPAHATWLRVALSADGKTAASSGATLRPPAEPQHHREFQVWDVDTGAERVRIRADHCDGEVALTADGMKLATTHNIEPGLTIYDAVRGTLLHRLDADDAPHLHPTFSPDGKRLAAAVKGGPVRVWDVETGKRLSETPSPTARCTGVVFPQPDRGVGWGVRGREVVAWEFPSGKLLTPTGAHGHAVTSVAFSPDGKTVFSANTAGVLAEWEPTRPAGVKATQLPGPAGRPPESERVTIAPGGTFFGRRHSWGTDTYHVYERATGRRVFAATRSLSFPPVASITFSPDETRVYVPPGYDHPANTHEPAGLHDLGTGVRTATLEGTAAPRTVAFSPDGKRLVTVAPVNENESHGPTLVRVWDAKTGAVRGEVVLPNGGGRGYAAVANSGSVVLATIGRVVVLDVPGGREGDTLDRIGSFAPGAVALSPDETRLAVGVPAAPYGVCVVRVYDWPRGRLLHQFVGHTGRVTALAFSPDGSLLASGSDDTSVVVWDMGAVPRP